MGSNKKLVLMDKKKFLRYTKCFKVYEEELTWDKFIKCLNESFEFCFHYNDKTIFIAFHYERNKKIYELNIVSMEKEVNFVFDSIDELILFKGFENKTIRDIWNELET